MTSLDVDLMADRLSKLAAALREHAASASPGEVLVDDVQFARLAEFLRHYPFSSAAAVVTRTLSGVSAKAAEDARSIDQIFRKVVADLLPHESMRIRLTKAIHDLSSGISEDRFRDVIRAWDGVQPLRAGRLATAIKVAEAWMSREGLS